ncbi:MAG: hypothetical protein HON90_17505 [Halobacteriovoraceae bacterium]|jgi:2-succinyl-5-enolpyruvyl-6-hydroxy-3-cyclohexene-1-carboxylate synthase|nr:hypothetical protein [Halobacteriovoraceae bacterium]
MNELSNQLRLNGVKTIYFGAGARNESLIEVLIDFQQHFCVDERAASFEALGVAKFSGNPVAICVTSGTAVAQCLPAMIEAYYSQVPLIVISADRPARLRHTHAPQAIDQTQIFNKFVKSIYCGSLEHFSLKEFKYPAHINIEIEHVEKKINEQQIIELSTPEFIQKFNEANNILVVCAEGSNKHQKFIEKLDKLNCLVYVECTSQLDTSGLTNKTFVEKEILNTQSFDLIIKVGNTPFTKLWRLLDQEQSSNVISFANCYLGLSSGFFVKESDFVMDTMSIKKQRKLSAEHPLDLCEDLPASELSIFRNLYQNLKEREIVFVGNSMPIRYLQMIYAGAGIIYASRGANGIDGQLSTAIGIAKSTDNKVHCLVGDLTFLYDLSACAQELPENIIIHVINNFGGHIFERIPVNKKMILKHKHEISQLISGFPAKNQIIEYYPCKEQTDTFWSRWNG